MKKADITYILHEAKNKLAAGEITQAQYDDLLQKMRERLLNAEIIDPVWEKPRRPITAPRAHIRGAWKKHLTEV